MFQDVSTTIWIVTFAVLGISAWLALIDLRRWRRKIPFRSGLKRLLLWVGAMLFLAWVADLWSSASSAAHNSTTGVVQSVQKTVYNGDREGMIACVRDCKAVLLNFDPEATQVVKERAPGTQFKVGFLEQRKEIYPSVFGFEVVDVWDSSGNQSLYHMDTDYHPAQMGLLILNAMALLLTGLLSGRLGNPNADPEDFEEDAQSGTTVVRAPRPPPPLRAETAPVSLPPREVKPLETTSTYDAKEGSD